MATDKGHPSGANKPENGTGIPANISSDKLQEDNRITEEYTDNDEQISDSVWVGHPNRNVDKNDATNAGGYRN